MKHGDSPVDLPYTAEDDTPMSPGDTNIWEMPTPRGDEPLVTAGPFANWKVANKYKILRTIGKGSYGEVVEATDERYDYHHIVKYPYMAEITLSGWQLNVS